MRRGRADHRRRPAPGPRPSPVCIDLLRGGGEPAELVDDAVHGTDVETSTRFLLYSRVVRREPGGTLSVGA